MEEKILEIFKYINDSTDNREYRMTKLKLLIIISINNLKNMLNNSNLKDKKILEDFKNLLIYLYYNFDSFYILNKKYEKGFKDDDDNLATYIGRFEIGEEETKLLKYIVSLIGKGFFENSEIEIENCPGAKNQAMLRLNRVYK